MRTLALVLGTTTLLLAAGCTLNTDYFGDYRGKNLLANYDFNAMNSTTPKWTTTSLGLNAALATTDNYMTWAHATDLSGTGDGSVSRLDVGPDGASPAYRLEIKNLLPDGDFEAEGETLTGAPRVTAPPPANMVTNGWALAGTTKIRLSNVHENNGLPAFLIFSSTRTLSHRSLLYASQNAGDYLTLSLDTALTRGSDSAWLAGQYRVRFDFYNVAPSQVLGLQLKGPGLSQLLVADAENAGLWLVNGLNAVSTGPLTAYSVSKTFTVTSASDVRTLVIGNSSTSASDAAIIDSVRVIPANLDLSATTQFPSLSSGSLQLLPGSKPGAYQFTVRVHDDPSADQNGASGIPAVAHSPNRFVANGLTVTLRGKAKNSPGTKVLIQQFVARPAAGWSTWTTITLDGGLDFVDSDADLAGSPALVISLTPSDAVDVNTEGKDAGSLLVSQPTLTFNP